MSDFVLKGFCKKCNLGTQYILSNKEWVHTDATFKYYSHEPIGESVLSAKQMEYIRESKTYLEWARAEEHDEAQNISYLQEFLLREPFLVARILKEAGEKK